METLDNANNCNNSESDNSEGQSPPALKLCFGCKQPIQDLNWLHVSPDINWHAHCLVCCECQLVLDEKHTCFLREGRAYCRKDFVRLFGIPCTACLRPIYATDFFRKAENYFYHLHCFACSTCEKPLVPGEMYTVNNGKLFCKRDYEQLYHEPLDSPTESVSMENSSNGTDNPSSTHNNPTPSTATTTTTATKTSGGGGGGGGATTKRSNSEKGPRMRTVLSEQQLQTLRTVYATNQRPDALMKEHLVEITGLSPRVIRVWFQNKRCKDKKKAIQHEAARLQQQQQQQQQMQGNSSSVLPPLTPQTPLTPDSMGQISPHPGMPAFTYPPAPSSYDAIPSTPTQTAVSPIVTYQQNPAWTSPTTPIPHFDPTADFSSPMSASTVEQSFVYSTAITSHQNTFF